MTGNRRHLWQRILIVATVVAMPLISQAQEPEATTALERERALAAAMHARDGAALERLLAPDYVLRSNPDIDRQTWMANALKFCWGSRSDIDRFDVYAQDGIEVASFELTFYVDPQTCQPAVMHSLITDVWTRQGDAWRLRTRHSGPVPAPGAGIAAQYGVLPELPPVWDVTGELSLVATGGNTSTTTTGLSADMLHRSMATTTRALVRFVSSDADNVALARALTVQGRHGFRVRPALEIFTRGTYDRDRFAGIEHRGSADVGASWNLRLAATHSLTAEAGAGFTHEDRLDATTRFAMATGTLVYAWRVTTGSELKNDATAVADLDVGRNWRGTDAVTLTVSLTRLLSFKASHLFEYRNMPVPGFGRLDRRSGVALVLGFKRRP